MATAPQSLKLTFLKSDITNFFVMLVVVDFLSSCPLSMSTIGRACSLAQASLCFNIPPLF